MAEGIFFHSTPQAGTELDAHGSWYIPGCVRCIHALLQLALIFQKHFAALLVLISNWSEISERVSGCV